MKKLYAMLAITLATTLTTSSSSALANSDSLCLSLANAAKTIAEGRELGTPEKDFINANNDFVKHDKKPDWAHAARMNRLVAYVYTMGYDAKSARKIVYLKCSAGDFKIDYKNDSNKPEGM